jgi:hypothetical protein
MTNALTQTRQDVADTLQAAGLATVHTMPDRLTPPVAIVKADDPYVQDGTTFTNTALGLVVQVVAQNGANEVMAEALDDAICKVIAALKSDQWTISVGEPYALTNGTAEYPAVDISISNWIEI